MEFDPLAREVLVSLSRLHPDRFVLLGGGALRLLHGSPRTSADLDLAAREPIPRAGLGRLAAALERDLAALPDWPGAPPACRASGHGVEVRVEGSPPLLVQFPPSNLIPPGGERRLVTAGSLRSELVETPTLAGLLFCKAVALLKRPVVKGRDAFDVWFLRERDARLDESAFDSWLRWEELGSEDIEARLKQLTSPRLKADLSRYLPEDLTRRLEAEEYSPVISATRDLFAPWLEE